MPNTLHEQLLNRILEDETRSREALSQLVRELAETDVLSVIGAQRVFLCPAVLSRREVTALAVDLSELLDLLAALPYRLYDGDVSAMCDAVGINGVAQDAVVRTWDRNGARLGRADLLRDTGGFKLVEFNVHSRMGGFENAALARAVLRIPLVQQIADEMGLGFIDTFEGLSNVLWRFARPGGGGKPPVIAVMDWPTVFPTPSANRISTLLCERGFDAFPCHVGQAGARDGALVVADRRIDVVYRTFLVDDLDSTNMIGTVLSAVGSGAANLVMCFGAELVGSKGALALLSDPVNAAAFTGHERMLIDRYVPWTRVLRPGSTVWQGREVALPDVAVRARRSLLLKPALGRGGQGVMAGWATPASVWREVVNRALEGPVRYVLQERVPPITDRMVWMTSAGTTTEEVVLNWGIFIFDGRYNGCIVRGDISGGQPVIGVGTGAAVACCIHPHLPSSP